MVVCLVWPKTSRTRALLLRFVGVALTFCHGRYRGGTLITLLLAEVGYVSLLNRVLQTGTINGYASHKTDEDVDSDLANTIRDIITRSQMSEQNSTDAESVTGSIRYLMPCGHQTPPIALGAYGVAKLAGASSRSDYIATLYQALVSR